MTLEMIMLQLKEFWNQTPACDMRGWLVLKHTKTLKQFHTNVSCEISTVELICRL